MERADPLITAAALDDEAGDPAPRRGSWLRFIARDKKALVGLIVLGVLTVAAVLAPVVSPYDPNDMMFDMIGLAVMGASARHRRPRPRPALSA